tara:strand:- start:15635 stop:18001 length:2367 start_codon:yes stop_codon:yes gene_type:complete
MSLITLNSNGQDPYFYANHFPQPISIKPYSQVCLLKFLHFRDSLVFNITTSNNTLLFCIGNTKQDGLRVVKLNVGQYTGPELATEIAASMNSVLQQQNYLWACTHTPEDDTTSPPTKESFSISYSTITTPALSGYEMIQQSNKLQISGTGATPQIFVGELSTSNGTLDYSSLGTHGLITNEGEFMVENIGFAYDTYDEGNLSVASNYGFNDFVIGICRDELANLNSDNANLDLKPYVQDLSISFSADGIDISTIKIAGNATIGTPNYATGKLCRTIPNEALQKLITQVAGKSVADISNMRFRFSTTFLGVSRRAVIQMEVSYNSGSTYATPLSASMGNDPQSNPYLADFTTGGGDTYVGAIWVSDKANWNDVRGGINQSVQNLVITKKAPFLPNINFIGTNSYIGPPDLLTLGLLYNNSDGDIIAFTEYTGVHSYDLVAEVDGGKTYYMIEDRLMNPATYTNINGYKASETDVAVNSASMGTMVYNPESDDIAVVDFDSTTDTWTDSSAVAIITKALHLRNVRSTGIMNTHKRPVSNFNAKDGLPFLNDDEIHKLFNAEEPDNTLNTDPAQLGTDLERQAIILLKQLNVADVAANSGAPAYLTNGQASGTLGGVIGSIENIVLGTSSGGATIFTSDTDTQKISKDTIINVSVPELSGVKSYNGIDNGAGANLSGEGKNLAVLPREEFQTRGENANGSLVYVAPFENWIDINNANELQLNQLSVEVRQPGGQLATDLRPDTITMLKLREDPLKVEERLANEAHIKLVGALSAATNTSQTLSNTMYNNGS